MTIEEKDLLKEKTWYFTYQKHFGLIFHYYIGNSYSFCLSKTYDKKEVKHYITYVLNINRKLIKFPTQIVYNEDEKQSEELYNKLVKEITK